MTRAGCLCAVPQRRAGTEAWCKGGAQAVGCVASVSVRPGGSEAEAELSPGPLTVTRTRSAPGHRREPERDRDSAWQAATGTSKQKHYVLSCYQYATCHPEWSGTKFRAGTRLSHHMTSSTVSGLCAPTRASDFLP
eukprot:3508089-Rhodomonas_salina.1